MDKELLKRVEIMFENLNSQSAAGSFPPPGTLADLLSSYVDPLSPHDGGRDTRNLDLLCDRRGRNVA